MRLSRLTAILCVLGVAACGDAPKREPQIKPSASVTFPGSSGKIALGPITVELPYRRGIGNYYRNYECWLRVRDVLDSDFPSSPVVANEVRNAIEAAKLTVLPGVSADIAAAAKTGADYYITASLPAAHANLCINSVFNEGPADIDAQVTFAWKIFSAHDQKLVFETNTSGAGHAIDPNEKIDAGVAVAVEEATKQLLQTATVQQYLTFGHVVAPPVPQNAAAGVTPPGGLAPIPGTASSAARTPVTLEPILVPVKSARPEGAAIDQAAARGVLVSFAVPGGSGGTGFVLGDGFVLTTASSLGNAVSATLTPTPGKTVEGRVLRRDADLDLALLKIDGSLPSSLPIRPHRVAVGDKVYGIGGGGVVTGAVVGTKAAGGRDQVKLPGAAIGGPVIDGNGNVVGMLQADGQWVSIGVVFRALNLGAQLSDE
jgi:S1-C subfamily serine protease